MKTTSRTTRRAASTLALLTLVAAPLTTVVSTSTTASARPSERRVTVERLHHLGTTPFEKNALVRTTEGVAIAAWPTGSRADGARDSLVVALRRPHHGWTRPHRIGFTLGISTPALAPLPGGRAVVAWRTWGGAAATRIWLPRSGWQETHVLSGQADMAGPTLASDVFARTWAVGRLDTNPDTQLPQVVLEVHHRGGAGRDIALGGDAAPCSPTPGSLAMDDRGEIAASWSYFCSSDVVERWAATVPADGGAPVTEQLAACDFGACDLALHILRTPTGFVGFGTVDTTSGHSTATWEQDGSGHWIMEASTHRFIRRTPAINRRGALVSCVSPAHRRIEVRLPGGAWHPIRIPAVRVEGCAVDGNGLVALIGTRDVRHHPLVLVWGNLHAAALTHVVRLRPEHAHYGSYPQVVLSDRGLLTALVASFGSNGQPQLGLSAARAQL